MNREEAIEVYNGLINTKIKEAFEFFAPELAESEDERIRTRLLKFFQKLLEGNELCYEDGGYVRWEDLDVKDIIAYLEKQKEQKVDIDKLRRDIYQSGYNDGYQHGKEDAKKEQKPAEWSEEDIKKIRSEEYTKGFNDAAFGGKAWKPSPEQMKALQNAVALAAGNKVLAGLYEQLKAL